MARRPRIELAGYYHIINRGVDKIKLYPSPLSAYRGFWGSKPFSKTNAYLKMHGKEEIDWALPKDTLF